MSTSYTVTKTLNGKTYQFHREDWLRMLKVARDQCFKEGKICHSSTVSRRAISLMIEHGLEQ